MAAIAHAPSHSHAHSRQPSGFSAVNGLPGILENLPNPHFVFPMQAASNTTSPTSTPRRPMSVHISPIPTPRRTDPQRQSVSALPTFNFNASNTSGLDEASDASTGQMSPTTPSRAMRHRRRASEIVGGDSRFGVSGLVTTSPTKVRQTLPSLDTTLAFGSPARKRGHAHRRSAAMSVHDLPNILQPRDVNVPPQTISAPSTPSEESLPFHQLHKPSQRSVSDSEIVETIVLPAQGSADMGEARPSSRPRVGFSENVEIIPRPLSTISSETDSSVSTIKGHSVTNSISSVMSSGLASPSPMRRGRSSLGITFEDDVPRGAKSLDLGRREGGWLKERSQSGSSSGVSSFDTSKSPRYAPKKKHFFNMDRRRSEPLLTLQTSEHPRVSSLSLQEPVESLHVREDDADAAKQQSVARQSSVKRVKKWASAVMHRRPKEGNQVARASSPVLLPQRSVSWSEQTPFTPQTCSAEPDLEQLFNQDPFNESDSSAMSQPRLEFSPPASFDMPTLDSHGFEDAIDLDAASGPFGTPSRNWDTRSNSTSTPGRRQLHSSRLTKDFVGVGSHYHRRAESAPALVPFDMGRSHSPSQMPMDDVFEEEEDESTDDAVHQDNVVNRHESSAMGIQVIDMAVEHRAKLGLEDGLGIQQDEEFVKLASQRTAAHSSHSSGPSDARRPSSAVVDISIEDPCMVEIVEDHEEPRTSSITKSSDSSDTVTMLAAQSEEGPGPHSIVRAASSYAESTLSSPDCGHRQSSFDTSRLGTSASSMTDSRTMSSFATNEPGPEMRMSVDDVPSLTSSRSTMISTMHTNGSRRDFSDRSASTVSTTQVQVSMPERRRKRSSIHSLSKLVGVPFGESRSKTSLEKRSQPPMTTIMGSGTKKVNESRLSRLMFWRQREAVDGPLAEK